MGKLPAGRNRVPKCRGDHMASSSVSAQSQSVLNSWKEISEYLGRGVRTAQRWERDLALPVRRPRGKGRSAVVALRQDLDLWLSRAPQGRQTNSPPAESPGNILDELRRSVQLPSKLRQDLLARRNALRDCGAELNLTVQGLLKTVAAGRPTTS